MRMCMPNLKEAIEWNVLFLAYCEMQCKLLFFEFWNTRIVNHSTHIYIYVLILLHIFIKASWTTMKMHNFNCWLEWEKLITGLDRLH